jgi:uncharacterized membrane protein YfcA
LIGVFGFGALEAVIVNKAMSLLVVATALPFRAHAVPFPEVASQWPIILNLLAGSLIGAWFGGVGDIGGQLLGIVSTRVLLPILALLLIVSAIKVWRHGY